jgi:large conductance mechanosensitive channel
MADKKSLRTEFREFVLRGNVMNLAVGVIIGGAFGTITNSLVNDILLPVVGMFLGGLDFSTLSFDLPAFAGGTGTVLYIGGFIQSVINFLILAWVIFWIVKAMNRLTEKPKAPETPPAPPEPGAEEKLLREIRDLLREGK